MPFAVAVAEMRAGAGGQFDPRVVAALLATVGATDESDDGVAGALAA
jgi:HD-GYP domain-containing protein (c-di-GMP phosphodiesterase class II)